MSGKIHKLSKELKRNKKLSLTDAEIKPLISATSLARESRLPPQGNFRKSIKVRGTPLSGIVQKNRSEERF
jgi:hypothetical protein